MRNVVLVDLDHTLSNAFPRDPMLEGPRDWDAYHSASAADLPVNDIAFFINALHNFGYQIISLTGRTEKWRALTLDWFTRHAIRMDELVMRPDQDFRPVAEMKMHWASRRFPNLKNEVAFLIDDNESVCAAFRAAGITVLQCFARRDA